MKKYMTLIILVTIITLILTSSVLALVTEPNDPPNGEDPPTKGNNGLGNGVDGQPPGNPPINDGEGNNPGNPGNKGKNK